MRIFDGMIELTLVGLAIAAAGYAGYVLAEFGRLVN